MFLFSIAPAFVVAHDGEDDDLDFESLSHEEGHDDGDNKNEDEKEGDDKDEDNSGSGRTDRVREEIKRDFREDGKRVQVERKDEIEDGKRKTEIRRIITDEDGIRKEIRIKIEEEDGKRKIRIEGREDIEVETELEIDDDLEGNESDIGAISSDGKRHKIKVLPDRASEIAVERLRAKNFTVELKEILHKNVPRVIYNIEADKEGKFLGVFKLKLRVEGQIDPETGEVIETGKPWWAFLVTGEDSDQTSDDDVEVEVESEDEEVIEAINNSDINDTKN